MPAELLSGSTPEEIEARAANLLAWRVATAPEPQPPPPPQTGAVSVSLANGVGSLGPVDRISSRYKQIQTRDSLSRMSPGEILAAWKSGALAGIGVGAPRSNDGKPLIRRGR